MTLYFTEGSRRSLVRGMKFVLRKALPWPVVTWCEAQYFDHFGEIELHLVRHLCRRYQDSIDVGANVGTYIHWMKRYSRQVYAFEPVPWLAALLSKKFGQEIVVEEIALSQETGTAPLHIPVIDGELITGLSCLRDVAEGRAVREITVQTRPLDEIYRGDVGFIKVDVEGHESSVIEGAERTIARCLPRVLVEAEERHAPGSVDRIRGFFRKLDYRGFFVWHRHLRPIEQFDPATMQRPENIAEFSLGSPRWRFDGYVNNFLFLPPDEPEQTIGRLEAALKRRAPAP